MQYEVECIRTAVYYTTVYALTDKEALNKAECKDWSKWELEHMSGHEEYRITGREE